MTAVAAAIASSSSRMRPVVGPAFPFITPARLRLMLAQSAEGFRAPLRILDASWYLPNAARNTALEYADAHLPGAGFWDIDAYSDRASAYPHMLPDAEQFAARMSALGVGTDDDVVVYDSAGIFSAPRLWWMLRAMGHAGEVFILQGGRTAWEDAGFGLSDALEFPERTSYEAVPDEAWLAGVPDVLRALQHGNVQIVDARAPGRFAGAEAEPRPGVEAGHMPGALNVPYATLLEGTPAMFKPLPELRAVFENAGVDLSRPVITSCGSGVTACILAAALHALGTPVAVYDGSWAEWGSRADLPKVRD